MSGRRDNLVELAALIGPGATVVDAADGWPGLIDLDVGEGETIRVAAHAAPITPMGRTGPGEVRPEEELRFQNPGSNRPPKHPAGTLPLLIGILAAGPQNPPALVIPSNSRVGNQTRFSVRFPGSLAFDGARGGWATYVSTDDERFWAISPRALPALALMRRDAVTVQAKDLSAVVQAAGPLADEDPDTKERARVASTRLARSATFRKRVLSHYGERCAFCGLSQATLLQAAHVYPVNLPDSSDAAANGVPACLHHHALLDAHLLRVDSQSLAVELHPSLSVVKGDPALAALIATTEATLDVPATLDRDKVSEFWERRRNAYPGKYDWDV